jgi:hypothetical protein
VAAVRSIVCQASRRHAHAQAVATHDAKSGEVGFLPLSRSEDGGTFRVVVQVEYLLSVTGQHMREFEL